MGPEGTRNRSDEGSRSILWLAAFAFALTLAYIILDGFALFRVGHYELTRQDIDNPIFTSAAYVGPYLFGLLGLVLLHAHARAWVRIFTCAVASLSISVFLAFSAISARGYTITEATLTWMEFEYIPSALRFHFWSYAPALLVSAAVIAAMEWAVRTRLPRIRTLWVAAIPLVACGLFYRLLIATDSKVDQFPIPYRVPLLTAYAFNHQSVYTGRREPVAFGPRHDPLADHVVFLVDESIRGDILSLNGQPLPTTPYLESIADRILNYGVASAIANLSAPVNIIIQSGLRPDELPDTELRSMRNPSLFAYMERAGFAPYLINSQNVMNRPPNFMSDHDVADLRGYWQVRNLEPDLDEWDVDFAIPEMLLDIITRQERSFTYVIKNGAHYPYTSKFSPESARFEAREFEARLGRRHAIVMAQYLNTVAWAVDEFMRQLVDALDASGERIVVVYTSDHGQSLWEPRDDDRPPIRGHGHHVDPPPEQAMVPLFLIPFGADVEAALRARYHEELRDRISSFEFFSSLLELVGYDAAELGTRYHHSIFDRDADRSKRIFVSGNHFGADGPLYRAAPYRSSFSINDFDPP